ncbi:ribonuclease H-like domain-containing protein [Tanacetum coccineum]|uniref:Ribonuclease H-like domain-containing protein n=1 Tax=Tanacetum coccineum TaxID=301880 RepID=A0ABQ5CII6_9ASTR
MPGYVPTPVVHALALLYAFITLIFKSKTGIWTREHHLIWRIIQDYQTGRLLLRCDSTGDLYPVTQQPSSQTLVVLLSFSSTTWHRRLGHPGDDVLRRKHAKLPFYNSESSVNSVFEIIHSDIWTSPIPSESGIKYYAIFLDHFSHFVWVYPLHKKSDLFDNFVAFRAYVNK